MKALSVAAAVESIAPIRSGMAGDELGFLFGDPRAELRGVAVCWAPTLPAIRRAVRLDCNLIVSHEPLFYQKRWSVDAEAGNVWFEEAEDADKPVNKTRAAVLERAGVCLYRAHSNWDRAPQIGVIDALTATLSLGAPVRRGQFNTVHQITPISVQQLARRVQRLLRTGPIRVVGNADRRVSRVGLMVGGLGQMFNAPEELAALGAEAVVAGECLAYTLHHASELDLALIEAGHCATENPGMRAMARWLRTQLRGVRVIFIDSGRPWHYLGGGR